MSSTRAEPVATEEQESPRATESTDEASTAGTEDGDRRYRWWSLRRVTEGAPLFPILVLFGLNTVDELDRAAFNLLAPEIRDHFALSDQGILTIVAIFAPVTIVAAIPIAYAADRYRRTRLAAGGAAGWAGFSALTGMAPNPGTLVLARAGSGLGQAVNDPTHNSLLADYYPTGIRAKVYAFHNAADSMGQLLGPIIAGILAVAFTWRAPFIFFAIPTAILVLLALRLEDPVRGKMERRAGGADEETAAMEDPPPPFGEAWRLLHNIPALRRLYVALPFMAASLVGMVSLMSLFYEEAYGIGEVTRGVFFAAEEPFRIIGLLVGTPIAHRLMRKDPGLALRFLSVVAVGVGVMILLVAVSPNIGVALTGAFGRALVNAILLPSLFAVFSLVIPPRTRALGFAVVGLYLLPGLVALPIIGGISDTYGIRTAFLVLIPLYLTGAFILSTGARLVRVDIENNQRWSALEAENRRKRARLQQAIDAGEAPPSDLPLLEVRDLSYSYGPVQVLFDLDLQVPKGSRIALLGTNGAGKSTLLKVIAGLAPPAAGSGGSIWWKAEDITYTLPNQRAAMGLYLIEGGKATFPSLTVSENLRMGAFPFLRDRRLVETRMEEAFDLFPELAQRSTQRAGTLSGGEQQMMAVGRALVAGPELLMIDELSLGLAPVVMGEILAMVDEIVARGTTLILVEQSLNVAVNMTDHAYFMEKGEFRFSGPTEDLLDRGDLARSVFFGSTGGSPDGA